MATPTVKTPTVKTPGINSASKPIGFTPNTKPAAPIKPALSGNRGK